MLRLIPALILVAALPATTASFGASKPWVEPVPGLLDRIDRDYLAPETEYGPGHRGIDFLISPKEPISAPVSGEVVFVGKVVNRMVLTIRGYDGYLAGFEPLCASVELNQEVTAGEVVGKWCEPEASYLAHCPKTCLHLSARNSEGYLNPLWLMGLIEPSRLMPLDEPVDSLP